MADQDVIIQIGSSNMAGYLANLYDVPNADYLRWISQLTPTALTPTRPYSAAVPGVRMWTPRRPYSQNAQRVVTAVGGGNTQVTFASSAITSPTPTADMWQFIKSGSGRGNIRRITAVSGSGPWTHTVSPANSPAVAAGDTLVVMQDSHTWASVSSDLLTVTKTAATPAFTSAVVGRFALFFDVASGTEITRKIASTDSANSITFDQPLSSYPATGSAAVTITFDGATERVNYTNHGFVAGRPVIFSGGTPPVEVVAGTVYYVTNVTTNDFQLATTLANALAGTNFTLTGSGSGTTVCQPVINGFCVLSGANSCEDLATINNAVLQNLTFTLDEVSPVYLTGLDYTNWDFTAFASPRGLSYDPTINSAAELTWHVRSKFGRPLVALQLGVSASMISPFAFTPVPAGGITATAGLMGPIHDLLSLDYHPSSPNGIYQILIGAISSLRTLIEAEGNTMKVRGIFINLFDNDGQDPQRVARIGANTVLLRDSLRAYLGDNTIPWIMSGPSAYAGGPGNPVNTSIYRQLFKIAEEDPKSGVVDTRYGYTQCVEDGLHLTAFSQIKLGQDFFRVWEPIYDDLTGKPPVVDIAICNRALTVIGESPNITSISPAAGSAHAPLCELLFPDAVRIVADSRHWTFADRRVALEKVRLDSPTIVAFNGTFVFSTVTPHGFEIGSPVSFAISAAGTGSVPAPLVAGRTYYVASVIGPFQFTVTATVGGYGTAITLTSVGSGEWRVFKESDRAGSAFMYALPKDCRTERSVVPSGAPDDWPGMDGALVGTPYSGIGLVASSSNGLNYSQDSTGFGTYKPIACKRAVSRGGDQVIYTDLESADLIYSRTLDDTTLWPPLFQEAVVFQLAAGLGGAIKRDVKIVDWCLSKAQAFISEAARVDGQRVVERSRQRYPWGR